LGIRKNVNVDLGLDINKILLVGLLVFTLVGSIGLYLPENLAFADDDDDDDDNDKKDKEKKVKDKEQIQENTANIETMSADFDLFKLIAAELNKLVTNMNNYIEDLELKIAGVEGELQKEIEAREAGEASFKAEIDAMKSSGDLGSATAGGSSGVSTYTTTVSGNLASDSSGSISASCETGDTAVSGGFTPISAGFEEYLSIFRSAHNGTDSWQVNGFNEDPSNSLQIDVFVNCLKTTPEDFIKATTGFQ